MRSAFLSVRCVAGVKIELGGKLGENEAASENKLAVYSSKMGSVHQSNFYPPLSFLIHLFPFSSHPARQSIDRRAPSTLKGNVSYHDHKNR